MRKNYEAPKLIVDEYVQDTMIASSAGKNRGQGCAGPKNGNFGNNQNCWGSNLGYMDINGNGDLCTG